MAGGIQKGTVATDAKARKLDRQLKNGKYKVLKKLGLRFPGLVMQSKLTTEKIPGGIGACSPDGGAWWYDGQLIAVFEAKKQQNAGNAIERWYKNNYIARLINPDVSYVTFAHADPEQNHGNQGEHHVIKKALNVSHSGNRGTFNNYMPGRNSCFLTENGFVGDSIEIEMINIIKERIKTIEGQKLCQ